MSRLSSSELELLDEVVLGSEGDAFCNYLHAQVLGQPVDTEWLGAEKIARQLGWVDSKRSELTQRGVTMAHPFRELLLWEERGRQMPARGDQNFVDVDRLRGKRVLEVGSGFGVNLLSLQGVAQSTVGVEIEEAYVQLTPLLSKKAGLETPQVMVASAEELPFESGAFDVVMCMGALQYMEFDAALTEMKRVTKTGGEVILVLGHFDGYLRDSLSTFDGSPTKVLRDARDVATMLTYRWLGRAFNHAHSPVYPTHGGMRHWLESAGLQLEELHVIGNETVYRAARA